MHFQTVRIIGGIVVIKTGLEVNDSVVRCTVVGAAALVDPDREVAHMDGQAVNAYKFTSLYRGLQGSPCSQIRKWRCPGSYHSNRNIDTS